MSGMRWLNVAFGGLIGVLVVIVAPGWSLGRTVALTVVLTALWNIGLEIARDPK